MSIRDYDLDPANSPYEWVLYLDSVIAAVNAARTGWQEGLDKYIESSTIVLGLVRSTLARFHPDEYFEWTTVAPEEDDEVSLHADCYYACANFPLTMLKETPSDQSRGPWLFGCIKHCDQLLSVLHEKLVELKDQTPSESEALEKGEIIDELLASQLNVLGTFRTSSLEIHSILVGPFMDVLSRLTMIEGFWRIPSNPSEILSYPSDVADTSDNYDLFFLDSSNLAYTLCYGTRDEAGSCTGVSVPKICMANEMLYGKITDYAAFQSSLEAFIGVIRNTTDTLITTLTQFHNDVIPIRESILETIDDL